MFAPLIPILLSFLVLAAHFFRNGHLVLVLACCAAPMFLLVRRTWATRIVQSMLIIGALEWVRTIFEIRAFRIEEGRDWQRMAIILGSVAAFTFLSGVLLLLNPLRRYYSPKVEEPIDAAESAA
jgi:hypothetical protein